MRQDEIVRRFGPRLRRLRRAHGMTQIELARAATVTVSYIWKLESGLSAPGLDLLARLATALGVDLVKLLPTSAPVDPADVLRRRVRSLLDEVLKKSDSDSLQLLAGLLAKFRETATG